MCHICVVYVYHWDSWWICINDKLTVFISGLAVTTCFSAGRNLFCLNSMSPTMNWDIKDRKIYIIPNFTPQSYKKISQKKSVLGTDSCTNLKSLNVFRNQTPDALWRTKIQHTRKKRSWNLFSLFVKFMNYPELKI